MFFISPLLGEGREENKSSTELLHAAKIACIVWAQEAMVCVIVTTRASATSELSSRKWILYSLHLCGVLSRTQSSGLSDVSAIVPSSLRLLLDVAYQDGQLLPHDGNHWGALRESLSAANLIPSFALTSALIKLLRLEDVGRICALPQSQRTDLCSSILKRVHIEGPLSICCSNLAVPATKVLRIPEAAVSLREGHTRARLELRRRCVCTKTSRI